MHTHAKPAYQLNMTCTPSNQRERTCPAGTLQTNTCSEQRVRTWPATLNQALRGSTATKDEGNTHSSQIVISRHLIGIRGILTGPILLIHFCNILLKLLSHAKLWFKNCSRLGFTANLQQRQRRNSPTPHELRWRHCIGSQHLFHATHVMINDNR